MIIDLIQYGVRMGEIANDLIMNCAAREDCFHNLELASFAVWQLAKMPQEIQGQL